MLRSAGVSRKVLIAELDDIEEEVEQLYEEEDADSNNGAEVKGDGSDGEQPLHDVDEEFANEATNVVSMPVEAHGADGSAWSGAVTHPK